MRQQTSDVIENHLVTLKNGRLTKVPKAEIFHFMTSIGFKLNEVEEGIEYLLRTKRLIGISEKLMLNSRKRKSG